MRPDRIGLRLRTTRSPSSSRKREGGKADGIGAVAYIGRCEPRRADRQRTAPDRSRCSTTPPKPAARMRSPTARACPSPISNAATPSTASRRAARDGAEPVETVRPAVEGAARLPGDFGGQAGDVGAPHIGRVAQHDIAGAGQRRALSNATPPSPPVSRATPLRERRPPHVRPAQSFGATAISRNAAKGGAERRSSSRSAKFTNPEQ